MKKKIHFLLSALLFLQYFIWGFWMVTMGTYLLHSLQFDGLQVGLIYGAPALAALVSPFALGLLADRYLSNERLMMVLQFLNGIALIYLFQVQDFNTFYIVILLQSFIFVPTLSLANSMVFHHAVDREKDFANIRVWGTIGFILASAFVSFLEWETTAYPLLFGGISSIGFAVFCFFLPHTPPLQTTNNSLKSLFQGEIKTLFFNRTFFVFVLCITLIRIPASFYYSFVNAYLVDIGMTQPTLKMALGQVVEIALILTVPFMLRRFGIKRVMLLGFAAWGLRYLGFAYGNMESAVWMLYVGMLLHGVCFTYSSLSAQIFIDQSVPPYLRNTAQGFVLLLTTGIGAWLGSYIAGQIVDMHTYTAAVKDWRSIWLYPAAIGGLVVLLFALFFKPNRLQLVDY